MRDRIASISNCATPHTVGWIGGNLPEYFLDKQELIKDFQFYLSMEHPDKQDIGLSVFIPKCYDVMLDHNIYPNCAVKVISHPLSKESKNDNYTLQQIKKMYLSGYELKQENSFITITSQFTLLQDEHDYFEKLIEAGYEPFLQIDEDYYPDTLLDGSYIFGYGVLYLYQHIETKDIISGFWQYS